MLAHPDSALVMHTGAAIGAQIACDPESIFSVGLRIRMAFIPLPLIGAGMMLHSLLSGHPAR